MSHAAPAPAESGSKGGAWVVAIALSLFGGGFSLIVSAVLAYGLGEGGGDNHPLFFGLAILSVVVWGALGGFLASKLSKGGLGIPFGLLVSLVVHAALIAAVLPRT